NEKASNSLAILVGDDEALELHAVQTTVHVDGFRARVILDAYFYSEYTWSMEGRFKMKLPDGGTPFYMAFGGTQLETPELPAGHELLLSARDARSASPSPEGIYAARATSWAEPREARMVTRAKAANAFRETVREQIDPALLEWSGPGMFNAALYPIEPETMHHVVIGYDVDLVALGDVLELSVPVPTDVPVATVDLDVTRIAPLNLEVELDGKPQQPADRDDTRAYFHFDGASGKTVRVRQTVKGAVALTGDDSAAGSLFAARFTPDVPETPTDGGTRRAVFLVDTSLSANPEQFGVWLDLMEATLDNNRDRIDGFAVLFFDVKRQWWRESFVDNTSDNVDALIADANELALE